MFGVGVWYWGVRVFMGVVDGIGDRGGCGSVCRGIGRVSGCGEVFFSIFLDAHARWPLCVPLDAHAPVASVCALPVHGRTFVPRPPLCVPYAVADTVADDVADAVRWRCR